MKLKRRIVALGAAAALVFAGCGAAAATDDNTSGSVAQQTGQPPQGGGGMDLTALAKALGVTEAKLQAAMEKNRPQQGQQRSAGRR